MEVIVVDKVLFFVLVSFGCLEVYGIYIDRWVPE